MKLQLKSNKRNKIKSPCLTSIYSQGVKDATIDNDEAIKY